jgi:hypothetical protein
VFLLGAGLFSSTLAIRLFRVKGKRGEKSSSGETLEVKKIHSMWIILSQAKGRPCFHFSFLPFHAEARQILKGYPETLSILRKRGGGRKGNPYVIVQGKVKKM